MSHEKLRELCNFQYWLGSNYETLPTNSVEMTERAINYTKLQGEKLHKPCVIGSSCPLCRSTNIAIKHDKTRAKCLHCAHDWAI